MNLTGLKPVYLRFLYVCRNQHLVTSPVTSPNYRTCSFINWTLPKFWSMRHLMCQQMPIFYLFIALVFFYDWTPPKFWSMRCLMHWQMPISQHGPISPPNITAKTQQNWCQSLINIFFPLYIYIFFLTNNVWHHWLVIIHHHPLIQVTGPHQ